MKFVWARWDFWYLQIIITKTFYRLELCGIACYHIKMQPTQQQKFRPWKGKKKQNRKELLDSILPFLFDADQMLSSMTSVAYSTKNLLLNEETKLMWWKIKFWVWLVLVFRLNERVFFSHIGLEKIFPWEQNCKHVFESLCWKKIYLQPSAGAQYRQQTSSCWLVLKNFKICFCSQNNKAIALLLSLSLFLPQLFCSILRIRTL